MFGSMGLGCDLEVDVNGEEVFLVDKVLFSVLSLLVFQRSIFFSHQVASDIGLIRGFPFNLFEWESEFSVLSLSYGFCMRFL